MMKSNAQKPLSSILNKGPKPGVNREHPAVKLAEKIEKRLWNWNYLGPAKTCYRIDELWRIYGRDLVNHFGVQDREQLFKWNTSLKGKGRVQVINALYDLLESHHPGVTFHRMTPQQPR